MKQTADPFAEISLKKIKPQSAYHDDFIAAPIYTPPLAFVATPGFKLVKKQGAADAGNFAYLATGLPNTEQSWKTGERPNLYARTAPGPLLKIGYGETIRVGPPSAQDGKGALHISPVALIGFSPATGKTLWGIDGEGSVLPMPEADKIRRSHRHGVSANSGSSDLNAVKFMLVLRCPKAPILAGESYLRRDDSGDVTRQGLSIMTKGPVCEAQTETALIIGSPYHDAPPLTLGFELFAGEPEPLTTEGSRQYARSELRLFRLGKFDENLMVGGGMSGDVRSLRNPGGDVPEGLREPLQNAPDGGAILGYACDSSPGNTVWYATNELTTKTRFVLAGTSHRPAARLGDMSWSFGTILGCADTGKGDDPAPARFPFAVRVLMKLPELPGDWPNRGVAEPLDWKIKIPTTNAANPYQLSSMNFPAYRIWAPTKYGNGAFFNRPITPESVDRIMTVREILRQAYAHELSNGLTLRINTEYSCIEAVKEAPPRRLGQEGADLSRVSVARASCP